MLLCCSPAFAVYEYYSLTRSVRSLGMGGAFYGLSDDEYAMFYNPAGLDYYRGPGKLMTTFPAFVRANLARFLSAVKTFSNTSGSSINTIVSDIEQYSGKPLYAEDTPLFAYWVKHNFAVGLLVADTKADIVMLGQNLNSSVDLTVISDTALTGTYSINPYPNLHVGATAKLVGRVGGQKTFSLVDFEQGNQFKIDPNALGGFGVGFDGDLGAIYDLPYSPGIATRVALTFSNLLGSELPLLRQGNRPPALVRMVSVGTSTVFSGWRWIDNVNFLLDFAEFGIGGESDPDLGGRGGSFFKHVNFGVEIPIRALVLRAGFHQGDYTVGLGLRTHYFELDAATYGEELMSGVGRLTSRRYALQIRLGWGAPPPPPVTAETFRPAIPVDQTMIPEAPHSPAKEPSKTEPNSNGVPTPAPTPAVPPPPPGVSLNQEAVPDREPASESPTIQEKDSLNESINVESLPESTDAPSISPEINSVTVPEAATPAQETPKAP